MKAMKAVVACAAVVCVVTMAFATEWTYTTTASSGKTKRLVSDDGWEIDVTLGQTYTNYEGTDFKGVLIGNVKVVGTGDVLDFSTASSAFDGNPDIVAMGNVFYASATGRGQIREVALPDTIVYIGDSTFRGCSNLEKLTPLLPSGVYYIGNYTFKGCSKLESKLELSLDGHKVGFGSTGSTFYGCSKISEIVFGEGVTSLPEASFRECTSLTNVTFGSALKTISKESFRGCSNLQTVTPFLPDTVTYVGTYAFNGCAKLGGVLTLGAGGSAVSLDSGSKQFFGVKGVTKIVLGPGVTSIPASCFGAMTAVTEVEFLGDYFSSFTTAGFGMDIASAWGNLQARLLLPAGNDTWKTFYEDSAKVGPCTEANLTTYHNRYGQDVSDPKGITLSSVNKYAVFYVAVKDREVTDEKPLQISGLLDGRKFEVGTVEPAYGEIADVETSVTCTAPEYADKDNVRYRCVGYVLSEYDPENGWVNPQTNLVRAAVYAPTDATYRQIAWMWEVAGYKPTVFCDEGVGSCTATTPWMDGFYAAGTPATFTATPAEGGVFVRWFGDVDASVCSNAALTVTMDGAKKLMPYFQKNWVIKGSDMTDGYWTIPVSGGSSSRALATPTAWPDIPAEIDLRKPIASGDTIKTINNNFLYYAKNHARIVRLPNTVTSIGDNAFRGQSTLVTVDPLVPTSVTYIGTLAFASCENLSSPVEIGNARKHPGVSFHSDGGVFESDYALRTVVLGEGVKSIPKNFVNQCSGIKEVTMLSDALSSVGYGAFRSFTPSVMRFASWPKSWGDQPFMNWTDYKACIYVPKGDAGWQAFMDDPTEMKPWTNLTTAQQQAFSNNFRTATLNPKGMTLKDTNITGGHGMGNQWIFLWNPKPSGMRIIFR